jgi:hypothetical protein
LARHWLAGLERSSWECSGLGTLLALFRRARKEEAVNAQLMANCSPPVHCGRAQRPSASLSRCASLDGKLVTGSASTTLSCTQRPFSCGDLTGIQSRATLADFTRSTRRPGSPTSRQAQDPPNRMCAWWKLDPVAGASLGRLVKHPTRGVCTTQAK